MKILRTLCLCAVSLAFGQAVFAQAPSAMTSGLTAQRVDTVDGKAVLTPATSGKPGDVIEYSGTYRNGGTAPVDKLLATIPVPAGTSFIAGSAVPAQAQASIDGVRFEAVPLMRSVSQADGTERKVAVPLAEYRALRWDIGALAAGRNAVVSLRVRIDPVAAPAASAAATATVPAKPASR
ncbi:MAG: hypothetical protein ABJA84_10525 [Polaromonas sp.]